MLIIVNYGKQPHEYMWKLENFISFSLKIDYVNCLPWELPTGQSGDLEAGPGDLTGRDKLLCYGYHIIQNRKNTATNITKTLILKS